MILMKTKRILAAILAFLALASFAGCKGEKKDNSTSTSAETVGVETSETQSDTANGTSESSSAKQVEAKKSEKKYSKYYLGIDDSVWNHWTIYKEHSVTVLPSEHNRSSVLDTEYTLDSFGNVTHYLSYEDNNLNAPNASVKYEYVYNNDGTVKTEKLYAVEIVTTSYEYDSRKRVVRETETYSDGTDYSNITTYNFNAAGLLTSEKTVNIASKAVMRSAEYRYDSDGNMIGRTSVDNTSDKVEAFTYSYDAQGNCIIEKCFGNDAKPIHTIESKYDRNGFVIYKKETNHESNGVNEYYYKRDKYENPVSEECYSTESGKKILAHKTEYTYDYGENEINIKISEIIYNSDGSVDLKTDSAFMCKYYKNTPSPHYLESFKAFGLMV